MQLSVSSFIIRSPPSLFSVSTCKSQNISKLELFVQLFGTFWFVLLTQGHQTCFFKKNKLPLQRCTNISLLTQKCLSSRWCSHLSNLSNMYHLFSRNLICWSSILSGSCFLSFFSCQVWLCISAECCQKRFSSRAEEAEFLFRELISATVLNFKFWHISFLDKWMLNVSVWCGYIDLTWLFSVPFGLGTF